MEFSGNNESGGPKGVGPRLSIVDRIMARAAPAESAGARLSPPVSDPKAGVSSKQASVPSPGQSAVAARFRPSEADMPETVPPERSRKPIPPRDQAVKVPSVAEAPVRKKTLRDIVATDGFIPLWVGGARRPRLDFTRPPGMFQHKPGMAFSVSEDEVEVSEAWQDSPEAVLAAMKVAMDLWGSMRVDGPPEFRALCAHLAIEHGLELTNSPEFDAMKAAAEARGSDEPGMAP